MFDRVGLRSASANRSILATSFFGRRTFTTISSFIFALGLVWFAQLTVAHIHHAVNVVTTLHDAVVDTTTIDHTVKWPFVPLSAECLSATLDPVSPW
jgi:hypothetical protein